MRGSEMRNKRFEVGDRVLVCVERSDCFAFEHNVHIPATLLYIPQATGDCYQFETEDGIRFVLNPQSSSFIGIEQASRNEGERGNAR
jgi:hypothetical protein